jgi:hypothetical protein
MSKHESAGDDLRHLDHRLLETRRFLVGVTVDLHTQKRREAEAASTAPGACNKR